MLPFYYKQSVELIFLFVKHDRELRCYAEHRNWRRGAETGQRMYLWVIAAATAYFIKGLFGFANTLVLTSILIFGADNANISPSTCCWAIPPT